MTPIGIMFATANGTTTIPITRDSAAWTADYDGRRFLITEVSTPVVVTPAKARFA